MKILHVLYQSIPNKQGTSIRTRDILRSQKDVGLEVVAITSPLQEPLEAGSKLEMIDGIKFYRTFSGLTVTDKPSSILVRIRKAAKILSFIRSVYKVAKQENVDVIHAHATFFTGIAGKITARLTGKPFIYEVRSLWEEGARVDEPTAFQKMQKKVIVQCENYVCNRAYKVVSINEGLKNRLADRGVRRDIVVIPNAYYFNKNQLTRPSVWPISKKGLKLGFIGSVNYYEGLELMIEAARQLPEFEFHVWGRGPDLDDFTAKIADVPNLTYNGVLDPSQIHLAYAELDVILNPRYESDLTNNVTPLKPIEAMGYGKLVIASDIGGMREIVTHGESGLLFADRNADQLIANIKWAADPQNQESIRRMISQAWDYIHEKRNWLNNGKAYQHIYTESLKKK